MLITGPWTSSQKNLGTYFMNANMCCLRMRRECEYIDLCNGCEFYQLAVKGTNERSRMLVETYCHSDSLYCNCVRLNVMKYFNTTLPGVFGPTGSLECFC